MASSQNADYQCSHSDEFYYTTPQSRCASYYRCHSNQKIKYDCPYGLMFDFYKQKCVSSSSKSTPFDSIRFIDKLRTIYIQTLVTSQHVKGSMMVSIQTRHKLVDDFFAAPPANSSATRTVEMDYCTTATNATMPSVSRAKFRRRWCVERPATMTTASICLTVFMPMKTPKTAKLTSSASMENPPSTGVHRRAYFIRWSRHACLTHSTTARSRPGSISCARAKPTASTSIRVSAVAASSSARSDSRSSLTSAARVKCSMSTKKLVRFHRRLNATTKRTRPSALTLRWDFTRIDLWNHRAETTFTATTVVRHR